MPFQQDSLLYATVSEGETRSEAAIALAGTSLERKRAVEKLMSSKLARGATIGIEVLHGVSFNVGTCHIPNSFVAAISDY